MSRTFSPHDEQHTTGRLLDRLVPTHQPPSPRETLAQVGRAVPPDERIRFLAGALTPEEKQTVARATPDPEAP